MCCEDKAVNVVHASVFRETDGESISPFRLLLLVRPGRRGFLKSAPRLTRCKVDSKVFDDPALALRF